MCAYVMPVCTCVCFRVCFLHGVPLYGVCALAWDALFVEPPVGSVPQCRVACHGQCIRCAAQQPFPHSLAAGPATQCGQGLSDCAQLLRMQKGLSVFRS